MQLAPAGFGDEEPDDAALGDRDQAVPLGDQGAILRRGHDLIRIDAFDPGMTTKQFRTAALDRG